jgi:predicted transport protein
VLGGGAFGFNKIGDRVQAQDVRFTELLDGAKQFIVPIFQRDYSWGTKHCHQLWEDILRVGTDPQAKGHFLGSVVYIAAEDNSASITRWLVIDGQQRLTTLTLLLLALRDHLAAHSESSEELPSVDAIDDYYLRNRHARADRRSKLMLRRSDNEQLQALIDGKADADSLGRVRENYRYFRTQLDRASLEAVFAGVKKLVVVDVCLTRGQDDPQMIFESLNSTGLDLSQSDLIRNFVLMRLDDESQTGLYEEHWRPMELAFGARFSAEFDRFVRDFLVLKLRPSKQFRADQIYQQFRAYFVGPLGAGDAREVLAEMHRHAGYYARFSLGQETSAVLAEPVRRLRALVEVAAPLMLVLYDCYERAGSLPSAELREAVELLESYVFRRVVCDMQTRSLYQIFATLAYRVQQNAPLRSLKVALFRATPQRRFPTDHEFRDALETRDIYAMRNKHYLLDRLENDSKERIDTTNFSVEHVLPQNPDLNQAWREMLGADWGATQEAWLHRLGNLTLTGYNPEYQDRSFQEKKEMKDGFHDSPLRLNRFVREQVRWTASEIEARGRKLSEQALTVWPALKAVDMTAVREADLAERRAAAARYSIDSLDFDAAARPVFEELRRQVLSLAPDVTELCTEHTVVYRVYDHFVELLPRKGRVALLVNLDFEDCDSTGTNAEDASAYAFIVHATETGGVYLEVRDLAGIAAAMTVVRQAYEQVAE